MSGALMLSSCRGELVAGYASSFDRDLSCYSTINENSAYCRLSRESRERDRDNANHSNRRNGRPGRYRGFAFVESAKTSSKVDSRVAVAADKYDLSDESAEIFVKLLDLMIKQDFRSLQAQGITLKDFEKIASGDKLSDKKLSELVDLLKLDDISHAEDLLSQLSQEIKKISIGDKKSSPLTGW